MGLHAPVSGTILQTTTVGPISLRTYISSTANPYAHVDALGSKGELRAICRGKNSKFIIYMGGNQLHANPSTGGSNRGACLFPHYYIGPIWRAPGYNVLSNAANGVTSAGKLTSMFSYRRSHGSDWDEQLGQWTFVHEPYNEVGDIIRYRMFYARTSQATGDGYFHHQGGMGGSTGASAGGHWFGTLQEIAQ